MARIPKPKKTKPPKKERGDWVCNLCDGDMTEEESEEARFTMVPRPCLMPGWKALVALGSDPEARPVVWGYALVAICPRCYPEFDAYLANLDALMAYEEAELVKEVWTTSPLTWTEVNTMMASQTAGGEFWMGVPEGRWRPEKEGVA